MLENNVQKEVVHGNITFPLSVYKSMANINKNILYCHYHDEVEFFCLTSGQATFFIDTNPIEIKSGEAIFINSGEIHSAYSEDFSSCEFYAIVFNLNMLSSNTLGECQSNYLYPLMHKQYELPQKFSDSSEWEKDILNQLKVIISKYINKVPAYEMAVTASLYSIICSLITNNQLSATNHINKGLNIYKLDQFKKALTFIQMNYDKKISILDIAGEANMSQYHFCRFFKKMSGSTPFEYLVNYRINQAEKLLNDTDKKILDIALDVGFDNVSYFIKTFKRIKNNTPSKFRKAYFE